MANGKIDSTDSLLPEFDLPAGCTSYPLPADEVQKPKPTGTGEGLTPTFPSVPRRTKHSKVPHRTDPRLVSRDVFQSIYDLRNLDTVFATLEDAHKAVDFLHDADWVHRDVNACNVVRSGKMAKLDDFDYAKRMDSKTTHELQQVTLDFMACEVGAQSYLFELFVCRPYGYERKCPFRFNPLHDMESLWWIAMWVVYYHAVQAGEPLSEQVGYLHKLFPGQLGERTNALLAVLEFKALPTSFVHAGYAVEYMRREILAAYTESEKKMPPAYANPLKQLHSVFTDQLTSAVAHCRGISYFSLSAKRQLEDSTSEDRDSKQAKLQEVMCSDAQ
ncbi:hypothetical protein BKA83DRAFT_4247255 [Pisolithus microcarpus]|nr:hypothetical protein BKA83DRAFT_4247255 [Pisolithus microcarpus]